MSIRKAKVTEYKQVLHLVKQVHQIHIEQRPKDFKNTNEPLNYGDYKNMIESDKIHLYIYEEHKDIVGYIILKEIQIQDHGLMKNQSFLHVEGLCVDEKHRKKGIGKKLMDFAKAYADKINASRLELNVWSFNQSALNFYKSLGMNEKFLKLELDLEGN